MTTNENALVTKTANFSPTLAVPDNAPPMRVDLSNPHLCIDDVLEPRFFSMAALSDWLSSRRADARLLTVIGVSMELLYDPGQGDKPEDGEWKPCLSFHETDTMLVVNKTRGQQMTKIGGTPQMAHWVGLMIAIKSGIGNGKAQVVIESVPDNVDIDEINSELFG